MAKPLTNRETADRKLLMLREALRRALAGVKGAGDAAVIRDQIDGWLEYRHQHQLDGTLDEVTVL